jgi:hypothetical protein
MRTLTDSELDAVAGGGLVAFAAADVTLGPLSATTPSIVLDLAASTLGLNALTAGVAGLAVGGPATVLATSVTGATALTTI